MAIFAPSNETTYTLEKSTLVGSGGVRRVTAEVFNFFSNFNSDLKYYIVNGVITKLENNVRIRFKK